MFWQLIILSAALFAVNGLPKMGKGGKGHPPPPQSFSHRGSGRLPYPAPGPPPEYLQEVSENAREEHFQLMMENEKMPKGQLKEELAKWAEKSGAKEEYEQFMADHEQKRKAYHDLMAANLAGDALNAFNKIWEITQNDQLTRSSECQRINDILGNMKMKIRSLVPLMAPQIMGPPPAECFPLPPPPRASGSSGGPSKGGKSGSNEEMMMKH